MKDQSAQTEASGSQPPPRRGRWGSFSVLACLGFEGRVPPALGITLWGGPICLTGWRPLQEAGRGRLRPRKPKPGRRPLASQHHVS